jgi:Zn-dependent membrane protease YugP
MLIAPSAYHRVTFHFQQKRRLVFLSNRFAIAGLALLAFAMTGAIVLITEVLFDPAMTAITGALAFAMFVVFWLALPLRRRFSYLREGVPTVDLPEGD